MSLDVSLTLKGAVIKKSSSGIFVREGGRNVEISEEEWSRRNPDREPVRAHEPYEDTDEVFSYNITHNLGKMAAAAGVYKALWRPEELGATKAKDLIGPLQEGLDELNSDRAKYEAFNPPNKWGSYDGLLAFVAQYLIACMKYPEAEINVCQ